MQYNYAKTIYGNIPPELATSQDTLNSVCAAYNYDVYTAAFGMIHSNDNFPRYNNEVIEEARNYYSKSTNNSELLDGTLIISDYLGTDSDLVIPSEIDGKTVSTIDVNIILLVYYIAMITYK